MYALNTWSLIDCVIMVADFITDFIIRSCLHCVQCGFEPRTGHVREANVRQANMRQAKFDGVFVHVLLFSPCLLIHMYDNKLK